MKLNIEYVHKYSRVYTKFCSRLCHEVGLPQTAFDILMFLANNPEYKTARDIVEIRKLKANLVSVNVTKLIEDGYLERKNVSHDRRKTELLLTEKAVPVVVKRRSIQQSFWKRTTQGISPDDITVMEQVFLKMSANLDEIMEEK